MQTNQDTSYRLSVPRRRIFPYLGTHPINCSMIIWNPHWLVLDIHMYYNWTSIEVLWGFLFQIFGCVITIGSMNSNSGIFLALLLILQLGWLWYEGWGSGGQCTFPPADALVAPPTSPRAAPTAAPQDAHAATLPAVSQAAPSAAQPVAAAVCQGWSISYLPWILPQLIYAQSVSVELEIDPSRKKCCLWWWTVPAGPGFAVLCLKTNRDDSENVYPSIVVVNPVFTSGIWTTRDFSCTACSGSSFSWEYPSAT